MIVKLPIQGIDETEVYQPMPMRIELPCSAPLERGIVCGYSGGQAFPSGSSGAWLVSAEASRETASGHVCQFDLFGQICWGTVAEGESIEIGDPVFSDGDGKLKIDGTGISGRALEATTESKRIIAFLTMWENTQLL